MMILTRARVLALATTFVSTSALAQTGYVSGNEFNPAISLILDGRYTEYHDDLELPGFQMGPESELPAKGFSLGHSELTLSANVDDQFYGSASLVIADHDGSTEVELEEAYLETLGLGHGATLKFGRFLSSIGYLNSQHEHAWSFYDAPLIYTALFGKTLYDDGVQARWLAPADFFLEVGAEWTRGASFPGGENDGNDGKALFIKLGNDLGQTASWQLGASGYSTRFNERSGEGHSHGHEEEEEHASELVMEDGDVDIIGVDAVFKWAPGGQPRRQQLVLQAEYFQRKETALSHFSEEDNYFEADYDGKQSGYYLQAVYRFHPQWSSSLRYDAITPDNEFSELDANGIDMEEFLEETELGSDETITRQSAMLEYTPSEFSRIRLQYNHRDWGEDRDDLWVIQYTMSLGSHGAHSY
ncbi:MAG: hypothetical protein VYA55_21525 [Pseudomonadota bacterium]|nr:hypothetical protein [Pseudomonadota bacterium]